MPGKDVKTMNRVILMGRLTKNPEIKYAGKDNDMAVARYTSSQGNADCDRWSHQHWQL